MLTNHRRALSALMAFVFAWGSVLPADAAGRIRGAGRAIHSLRLAAAFASDFIASQVLPAGMSYSATNARTMYDITGKLTYAPNNLLTQSNTFSNAAWQIATQTVSGSATQSPDGTTNASLLSVTGTGGQYLYNGITAAIGTNVIAVVHAKANVSNFINISLGNASSYAAITVNLTTGAVTQSGAIDYTLNGSGAVNVGSGWWRVYIAATIKVTANPNLAITTPHTGTPAWSTSGNVSSGTVGDSIYIYNAVQSLVTYETAPRAGDQVITTTSAYYGPRFDYDPSTATYSPNNLLLQSNNFSDAGWDKTTGTITAGVADRFGGTSAFTYTATGSSSSVLTRNAVTFINGSALSSIWARRRTGTGNVQIYDVNTSGNTTLALTSSWQQFYVSTSVASGRAFYLVVRTLGDAIDVAEANVSAITTETTPRAGDQVITTTAAYGYPLTTCCATPRGLLIEEARTNLLLQSNGLGTTPWINSGTVVTANATTSPDGTTNAFKVAVGGSGIVTAFLYQSATTSATAGNVYTTSAYFKYGQVRYAYLAINDTIGDAGTTFDLQTGAVGSNFINAAGVGVSGTSTLQAVGNGWYRATVSKAVNSGATNVVPFMGAASSSTTTAARPTYSGTVGDGFYAYQADASLGSVGTSPIPTATATVLRSADVAQFTGAALATLQGANASITVTTNKISVAGTRIVGANNSDSPVYASSATAAAEYPSGVVLQATIGGAGSWLTGTVRAAVSYTSAGGRSVVANGGTVATDSASPWFGGTPPAGFYLGSQNGSSGFANAWFGQISIFNFRLSDASMQSRTSGAVAMDAPE